MQRERSRTVRRQRLLCLFLIRFAAMWYVLLLSHGPWHLKSSGHCKSGCQPWSGAAWWFITALIFQSLMEGYWSSSLAFQATGKELDMGFWTPNMLLFYVCLPAGCYWTFAKPTVYPHAVLIYLKTYCSTLTARIPSCFYGLVGGVLVQSHLAHPSVWPWNPGICSLLLLSFVRWQAKTLMGDLGQLSCTVVCLDTYTGVCECLQGAKGRGQMLAQAAVFVMVACGRHSIGQKTCWEPLCHPNRPAWVTSNHSNNSFLGSRFRKSLSHYRRFQRHRSVFSSTFTLIWTFRIHKLKSYLHAQHIGAEMHSVFACVHKLPGRALH